MHMKLHGWKTVSGFLFSVAILAVGGGSTGAELGCSSSSGDDGSGSGSSGGGSSSGSLPVPSGCAADDSIDCSGGGTGFSCPTGDNPENIDPTYDCSTPQSSDGEDDFCCFTGFDGSSSSCVSDDDLTSVCPDPDSYGFQCDSGDDPSTLDPSLDDCSTATPDPDGVHDDFCCDLSGGGSSTSSSGGSVPTGCTADDSLNCDGGGDGYSCDSGDNPEEEDDTLSCSDSTPDPDGVHDDFCCITGFDGSSSTCVADDTLDCTAGDAYGYQCDSGDDPTSLDSSLTCSDSTPDPDGVHDDFCCNP
jgi:hypothetical protein